MRRLRLAPTHRAGRLLDLVDRDLPAHTIQPGGAGATHAHFAPVGTGVELEVSERVERQFLGRSTTAVFAVRCPAGAGDDVHLVVRHTGRFRRSGIEVVIRAGGHDAQVTADRLREDDGFTTTALALDFRRFDIARVDGEWSATVELVGATVVSIALPPLHHYVRLYPDQRAALLACLDAVLVTLSAGVPLDRGQDVDG